MGRLSPAPPGVPRPAESPAGGAMSIGRRSDVRKKAWCSRGRLRMPAGAVRRTLGANRPAFTKEQYGDRHNPSPVRRSRGTSRRRSRAPVDHPRGAGSAHAGRVCRDAAAPRPGDDSQAARAGCRANPPDSGQSGRTAASASTECGSTDRSGSERPVGWSLCSPLRRDVHPDRRVDRAGAIGRCGARRAPRSHAAPAAS